MQDPSKPVSQQLIREARIGLTIVALLAGLFCYVAWNRFSGNWNEVPEHVANAPIAKNMNQEFREQHRRELAKLDLNPRISQDVPIVNNSPNRNINEPGSIQQTFTQRTNSRDAANVATPQKIPQPHLPISTNELRAANPHTAAEPTKDAEVQPASFTDEQGSPEGFDDPFGTPTPSNQGRSITPNSRQEFVPREPFKLSDEEASQFKPNLNPIEHKEESTPANQDNPPSNTDNSSFRGNSRQPSVVMQRTRFQVQVIDDESTENPTDNSVAQKTNVVDNALIGSDFNPIRRPLDATTQPLPEHKPLTRAEDFATHSLHPPRPLRSQEINPTLTPTPIQEFSTTQRTVTHLKEHYTVEAGRQTLWEIAQDVYEDGRLFRALYEVNRNEIPNPDEIQVGTNLTVPSLEVLIQNYREHIPVDLLPSTELEAVHVTRQGDTLFDIARQRLGQASRFNELLELNRGRLPLDVTHLSPLSAGMQIELPAN